MRNTDLIYLNSPKKFLMREDLNQEPLLTIEETSKAQVNLTDASAIWDDEAKDNKGVGYNVLYSTNVIKTLYSRA